MTMNPRPMSIKNNKSAKSSLFVSIVDIIQKVIVTASGIIPGFMKKKEVFNEIVQGRHETPT